MLTSPIATRNPSMRLQRTEPYASQCSTKKNLEMSLQNPEHIPIFDFSSTFMRINDVPLPKKRSHTLKTSFPIKISHASRPDKKKTQKIERQKRINNELNSQKDFENKNRHRSKSQIQQRIRKIISNDNLQKVIPQKCSPVIHIDYLKRKSIELLKRITPKHQLSEKDIAVFQPSIQYKPIDFCSQKTYELTTKNNNIVSQQKSNWVQSFPLQKNHNRPYSSMRMAPTTSQALSRFKIPIFRSNIQSQCDNCRPQNRQSLTGINFYNAKQKNPKMKFERSNQDNKNKKKEEEIKGWQFQDDLEFNF